MATGITEQDVWKAADALLIEGQRPTIERVRQKIGRGSPNTVQPYLDTWFKGLGARIRDPEAFSAAVDVPDPIVEAARYLWEAATAEAREQAASAVKAERDALRQARDEVAQTQHELARRESTMLAQIETATSALESSYEKVDTR